MPIYAYKCNSCGYAKDVLRKVSDAPLNECPSCGAATFQKQLTAAGFQLKGSGWYATDFKGGKAPVVAPDGAAADARADQAGTDKAESGSAGTAGDKAGDKATDRAEEKAAAKTADKKADAGSAKPAPSAAAAGGTAAS